MKEAMKNDALIIASVETPNKEDTLSSTYKDKGSLPQQ